MPVLDDIRRFEEHLVERLRELEPLVREYEQLRAVAQQLEVSYTPGEQPAPTSPPPRRARAATAGAKARTRTARRRADDEVVRIVGEAPGITVRGISDRLRVNRPDLYRLTNALAKDGRLRKDGPKLYLAKAPPAAPQSS
jgi:hypothetical protein